MKKNINTLLILVIAILFASCVGSSKSNEEENLKVIEQYQLALQNLDYETMASFLTDDYVSYGPSHADSMGREDLLVNWKYNMEHLYEKLEFKAIENVALTGYKNGEPVEWVSSWGILALQYKENSNEAIIWSNTIFNIVDGKIKKSYMFFNEADALRQLGYKYTYVNPNRNK